MDVYLFSLLIPVSLSLESTHASVLELEIIDAEVCVGSKASEKRRDISDARGFTTELYSVEVHQV